MRGAPGCLAAQLEACLIAQLHSQIAEGCAAQRRKWGLFRGEKSCKETGKWG